MSEFLVCRPALREAAEWLLLQNHVEADHSDFETWLEASLDNRGAYASVERAWAVTGAVRDSEALQQQRLEALQYRSPKETASNWRRYAAMAAGLMAMATIGFATANLTDVFSPFSTHGTAQEFYAADIGERSLITLEDGTRITLNSGSRIAVDAAPRARHANLIEGEALFEVAHDPNQPFVVETADYRITVLGTVFNVLVDRDSVAVALAKGRVKFAERAGSGEIGGTVTLKPGQQAIGNARAITVSKVDVADIMMWRLGRIRFRDTPVSEALAKMARYSRTPIEVGDPGVAHYHISGTFRTGNPKALVTAVTEAFPLEAERDGGKIVVRSKKD